MIYKRWESLVILYIGLFFAEKEGVFLIIWKKY